MFIFGRLIAVTRCPPMLATECLGWGVVSGDEGLAGLGVAVAAGVPDKPPTTGRTAQHGERVGPMGGRVTVARASSLANCLYVVPGFAGNDRFEVRVGAVGKAAGIERVVQHAADRVQR